MFADGFQLIMNTAWGCVNTVIIPAGSFGDHGDITFLNCLVLLVGCTVLVKFFRFATGGRFNIQRDSAAYRPSTKPNDINNFMHDDGQTDSMIKYIENRIQRGYK